MQVDEERSKQVEALCRAMPLSRMVDYGMPHDLAERAHRMVKEGAAWDVVLEDLGREQEASARAEEDPARARDVWHAAAASLVFAQMAFNADSDRKRSLYQEMTRCFTRFAARSEFRVLRVHVEHRGGKLFGWHFHTGGGEAPATVIVFGGLSGWSTAYRSMAETLNRHGLDCLLVDGPGQGDSRLEGGVFADADIAAGFSRFIDHIHHSTPRQAVGIWGDSFGGLFAALTAVHDRRLAACCINGAPPRAEIPPFRTAQEQLAALFGASMPATHPPAACSHVRRQTRAACLPDAGAGRRRGSVGPAGDAARFPHRQSPSTISPRDVAERRAHHLQPRCRT